MAKSLEKLLDFPLVTVRDDRREKTPTAPAFFIAHLLGGFPLRRVWTRHPKEKISPRWPLVDAMISHVVNPKPKT